MKEVTYVPGSEIEMSDRLARCSLGRGTSCYHAEVFQFPVDARDNADFGAMQARFADRHVHLRVGNVYSLQTLGLAIDGETNAPNLTYRGESTLTDGKSKGTKWT